jgi:hypothetical protein
MEKEGKFWKTLGYSYLITLLIMLVSAVYFYEFHVFKEFRSCVSNNKSLEQETMYPCVSNEECFNASMENMNTNLEEMPGLIQEEITNVLREAIYCNETCKVKEIYGDFVDKHVDECLEGDTEFLLQLKGKQLWEMRDHIGEEIGLSL